MSSLTALRNQLKSLRNEHAGKPISKMSQAEIQRELEHHELGCKTRALKEKRLEALAKAREARAKPKAEPKEEEKATHIKVPELPKKKSTKTEHDAPAPPKIELKESKKKTQTKKVSSEVEEVKEKKPSSGRSLKMMKIEESDEE